MTPLTSDADAPSLSIRALIAEGAMAHGGRTTQVWDVVVGAEDSQKAIALFRCTQMLLYRATSSPA